VDQKTRPTKKGVDQELYDLLTGCSVPFAVTRSYDIFTHEYKRETLEALLLAGADAAEIEQVLRVSPGVTEVYKTLFFDVSVFEDSLDVIDYAKSMGVQSFGGELKQFAVDLGKECLKIRLAGGEYSVNPSTVLDGVRATAFMMTQIARINRIDSSFANSALRWAQVSLRAVPEKEESDESNVEKLKIALETRDETTNEEDSGVAKETILH
jgi:hypothetical protein